MTALNMEFASAAHVAMRSDGRWLAIGALSCNDEGYVCVVCGRLIEPDETGVMIHDEVPHPTNMLFNDEDQPQ